MNTCHAFHIVSILAGFGILDAEAARAGDDPPAAPPSAPEEPVPSRPVLTGDWWRIAGNPDVGEWTSEDQQPVDFAVWQAADRTWQLWSCIRHTKHPGRTRVFHAWEGQRLTDTDWKPQGITFTGDPTIGETAGGMQAPYVIRVNDQFRMYYGDYRHICLAVSEDGKQFEKMLEGGMTGLFGEGPTAIARDPMLLKIGPRWYCYYSAHPKNHPDGPHGVWLRTSTDGLDFGPSRLVMTGGQAGDRWWNFECPHVVRVGGWFYLFHTQNYAPGNQQTSVYRSADPTYFGLDDDTNFVTHLPVAAPELIHHEGRWYLAALAENLDGIRVIRLDWVPDNDEPD